MAGLIREVSLLINGPIVRPNGAPRGERLSRTGLNARN